MVESTRLAPFVTTMRSMILLRRCATRWRSALLVVLVCALLGCSAAGKWNDDPENWERAFSSTKPDAVVVVHSRYWRSPHWTTEFEYFFQIHDDAGLRQQLFTENTLTELTGEAAREAFSASFAERPTWFLEDALESYTVWILPEQPDSHFRVFVHRETGDLFLTDYQV
jgi:hypothetical protein